MIQIAAPIADPMPAPLAQKQPAAPQAFPFLRREPAWIGLGAGFGVGFDFGAVSEDGGSGH